MRTKRTLALLLTAALLLPLLVSFPAAALTHTVYGERGLYHTRLANLSIYRFASGNFETAKIAQAGTLIYIQRFEKVDLGGGVQVLAGVIGSHPGTRAMNAYSGWYIKEREHTGAPENLKVHQHKEASFAVHGIEFKPMVEQGVTSRVSHWKHYNRDSFCSCTELIETTDHKEMWDHKYDDITCTECGFEAPRLKVLSFEASKPTYYVGDTITWNLQTNIGAKVFGGFYKDGEYLKLQISEPIPASQPITLKADKPGKYQFIANLQSSYPDQQSDPIPSPEVLVKLRPINTSMLQWNYTSPLRYDGTSQTVLVRGALPEGVSFSYSGNTATVPGEYTASAEFVCDPERYEAPKTLLLKWEIKCPEVPLLFTESTPEGISFKWYHKPHVAQYELQRGPADEMFALFDQVYIGDDTSFLDKGAILGQTYLYRMRTLVSFGGVIYKGDFDPVIRIKHELRPKAPAVSSFLDGTGVQLGWAAVPDAKEYALYCYTIEDPNAAPDSILLYRGSDLQYTHSEIWSGIPLSEGLLYQYFLVITDKDGKTSPEGTRAFIRPLSVVTGLKADKITSRGLELSWNKHALADIKYQVFQSKTKDGGYAQVYEGGQPSFSPSNLEAGTTYYYKVRHILTKEGRTYASIFSTAVAATTKVYIQGDADDNKLVNQADLLAVMNYLMSGTPLKSPENADTNRDGTVDLTDLLWLVNYVVK